MSETTWPDVGRVLLGRWTEQVARWGSDGMTAFIGELMHDGLTPARAVDALRSHASDFPPSASTVTKLAERAEQGAPPSLEEIQREIAGRLSILPSVAGGESAKKAWPAFIARLAEHHEVTARFAEALGPKGVRDLPDPRHAHGAQTESARKSLARSVGDWEADPRRGLAAAAATVELGAGGGVLAARRELSA